MRTPLSLGWVSSKLSNPSVVIADADGYTIAQALGRDADQALEHACAIVLAVNNLREVK